MDAAIDDILQHKSDENEDFYTILGCDELSSKDQIVAEYKARVLSCHPDKHPGNAEKAKEFERLQNAKDVLCDEDKRENYDKWRRSGISVSYRRWCNMRESVHTSMHWASPKKEYMLEGSSGADREPSQGHMVMQGKYPSGDINFLRSGQGGGTRQEPSQTWTSDSSEMLRKFRNYEI